MNSRRLIASPQPRTKIILARFSMKKGLEAQGKVVDQVGRGDRQGQTHSSGAPSRHVRLASVKRLDLSIKTRPRWARFGHKGPGASRLRITRRCPATI